MLPVSALKEMYPVIMTPSHDGKYFHNYVLSLLNLVHRCASDGLNVQVVMQRGESLITRARNNCVAQFLENKEWTHLVWIDSDIGFSAEAFRRLLLADRDIAAGIYPLKRENWPQEGLPEGTTREDFERRYASYTINAQQTDENGNIALKVDADGFMRVEDAPTGFMAVKRSVFEKMAAAYPELRYVSDSDYAEDNGFHYRFYDCMIDPESRRYLSEDYAFCRLWQQIGGEVYVDVQSNLTHQGAKIYSGAFAESLQTNLSRAVSAPKGVPMRLETEAPLKSNPRGFE
ncbi:hypothetical protein [Neisseria chenwenguii]|uniref:Uncharacterized protein n=1 Tax=Neisseria chenwenguii TaxID=1853278 RepID=A0A220S2K3_9NEIS|nr:hypothetical protein [Neisseria chenwenguii]ASK27667.1 hypothetical protein BG910_07885 [Neisseria chenwenguii]ROV55715.1 hypothetical protein EGS38_08465 [Neisseria chenwenguii]